MKAFFFLVGCIHVFYILIKQQTRHFFSFLSRNRNSINEKNKYQLLFSFYVSEVVEGVGWNINARECCERIYFIEDILNGVRN